MILSRRHALLALLAAGATPRGALAQGRTLTVSQFSETRDLAALDPMRSLDYTIPSSLIFDTLLERDAEGHLLPHLAEKWERIAPTTWRFTIRQGVRFHDGSALTAADAAATLQYGLDPANRSSIRFQTAPLVRAEAPDAATLLLHTSTPSGLLPQVVGAVPVLQAAQLAAADAPFRTRPIGSGPWKMDSWRAGERVEMVSAGPHWRHGTPAFDRVLVRAVPEASTRVADLLSGGAQIAGDIPPGLAARVGRGGARLVAQSGTRTQYLSYWFKPPFDDARVRRAVHHAIDRNALREASWGELAETGTGAVPRAFGGYVEAFPLSDHDPDRSRALLREAGVTAPLAVELDAPPTELAAAQVLQSQLQRAGFAVRINPLDSLGAAFDVRRYATQERGRMFIATALDNHSKDAVRPYAAFYVANTFLTSMGYRPDERLAALYADYLGADEGAERQRRSAALMAVAAQDAAVEYLAFPKQVYGVAAGIEMPLNAHGRIDFTSLRPRG